jgi:fatty acid desaturase/cytochrome b involved in lipid metabolism
MAPHSADTAGLVPSDELRLRTSNSKGPEQEQTLKKYTLEDVSRHNTPADCWLVIWGKVYDVTSWIPNHPGGSLIHVKAGQDSTQLFDSYHPLYVRKMLAKYCIGELVPSADDKFKKATLEYADAENEDFYLVVKQRVESYFKSNKINPQIHPHMILKSLFILGGYFASYYLAFFWSSSVLVSLFFALWMGFFAAEVGVSIQHDGNHGSYTKWRGFGYIMGASLDLVGASSFMWRQQHVVGHHSFTNVDNYDPDIRVKDPDVRRVATTQPRQWYHAYQHIYLAVLYGTLALKSIFLDDFLAYFTGSIGPVKVAKMTPLEFNIFFQGKLLYAFYMFVLPSVYGVHSGGTFLALYVASQLITGWMLAFLFQVAHVVDDVAFPTPEGGKVKGGWAAMQVATTTDFSPRSWFWSHVSGGLNNQIEHHLFPGVCHVHYPAIQPIVEKTCKEFDVPYVAYPTFWTALRAHFAHLKKVGMTEFRLDG